VQLNGLLARAEAELAMDEFSVTGNGGYGVQLQVCGDALITVDKGFTELWLAEVAGGCRFICARLTSTT
jgi:hypothetical protein